MCTSDIKSTASKTAKVYLAITAFCAVFGAVYECFSHGVFSFFMAFCFLIPLLFGAIPFFIVARANKGLMPRLSYNLYNAAVPTLLLGFIFKGVLDIYGTTNRLLTVYFVVSGILFTAFAVSWILISRKQK